MDLCITPSILSGTIVPPPSKSYAHRAVLCAALAKGESLIENIELSDDISATLQAVKSLGASYDVLGNQVRVRGICTPAAEGVIDCNESGSTLRFLLPIVLSFGGKFRFVGRGKLGTRPLNVFNELFRNNGIRTENHSTDTRLDLLVEGKLCGGEYTMSGNISSQFITGMLFALSCCDGPSVLHISDDVVSGGYIDITMDVLRDFGAAPLNEGYRSFSVSGSRPFISTTYFVEPDYSQAAFFAVANFLGAQIDISHMNQSSVQGDRVIFAYLQRLSAAPDTQELVFDAQDCPDIIPVFAVACALRRGTTLIKNAGRLRIKECDRLHAIARELNALGAHVQEGEDTLLFTGVDRLHGGEVSCHADHRIAMSLAIASTRCTGNVVLHGCECVNKSYPGFFEDFSKLGGKVQ